MYLFIKYMRIPFSATVTPFAIFKSIPWFSKESKSNSCITNPTKWTVIVEIVLLVRWSLTLKTNLLHKKKEIITPIAYDMILAILSFIIIERIFNAPKSARVPIAEYIRNKRFSLIIAFSFSIIKTFVLKLYNLVYKNQYNNKKNKIYWH